MGFKTVSVFGLGYIGLPTATILAQQQVSVIGVDVSRQVVEAVNAGKLHIVEPHLDVALKDAVEKGYLRATSTPEPADVFVIAVPTPFTDGHKPDVSHIRAVAAAMGPVLKRGDLVILESTSPVGTTERLGGWLADARPDLTFPQQAGDEADVQIAYCPERVLPGKVLFELVANDRIVGGMSANASQMAKRLYKIFVKGDISVTTPRTAEMCKLTENSFRDVNIAFANELSVICDKLNINVWELVQLANKHPRVNILQAGCGVGGHCIAVDPWFIVDGAPKEARLIRTAREINDDKPNWILEKVNSAITSVLAQNPQKRMPDVTIACLGLSFKPDIDDLRESPALHLTENIARLGCQVLAVEPHIETLPQSLKSMGVQYVKLDFALSTSDILCIFVAHRLFIESKSKILKHKKMIDATNILYI